MSEINVINDTVNVVNKSGGLLVYTTSFGRREFAAGQTRKIKLEELKELAQLPGGTTLLLNYLFIEDPAIMTDELEMKPEPEYYIKEEDLPNWMNTCSLDEFKDALDFAPLGTKDLIKRYAVSMPLNDYSKRQAIKDQLGLDVSAAVENMKPDPEDEVKDTKPAQRRVASAANETGRRATVNITIPKS